MWTRKSYHEIASELNSISERFRAAEAGCLPFDSDRLRQTMIETSISGVELLRALALAIRSEQDYGNGLRGDEIVGCLVSDTDQASYLVNQHKGIPESFAPQSIGLRDALNKVAHANPGLSSYNVEGDRHDLILSGTLRSQNWVAVISLPKIADVLRAFPDHRVPE